MLSSGSEQQGQKIKVIPAFLALTKILDLLGFFHQVCKKTCSVSKDVYSLNCFSLTQRNNNITWIEKELDSVCLHPLEHLQHLDIAEKE